MKQNKCMAVCVISQIFPLLRFPSFVILALLSAGLFIDCRRFVA
jgi:hypothetical protein